MPRLAAEEVFKKARRPIGVFIERLSQMSCKIHVPHVLLHTFVGAHRRNIVDQCRYSLHNAGQSHRKPVAMFNNQVVAITGAGRGIGEAAAHLFAKHGAVVVVNDLDPVACSTVVAQLQTAGARAVGLPGDVTDPTFADRLVEYSLAELGSINVLVNNAGYTWDGMLHKMKDDQWSRILDIHVTAPFRIIRALSSHWREAAKHEIAEYGCPQQKRCIVNVSSTSGLHGNIGQANYATAKMGIVGLTKTLAKEWGRYGIRCNTVAFGFIHTRLTRPSEESQTVKVGDYDVAIGIPSKLRDAALASIPMGRLGTALEAAGGIVLLASPFAGYITGHTLEVTGGLGI